MPAHIVCHCCNKPGDDSKMAPCSVCKNMFFYSCVNLSQSEVKSIQNKSSINWTCKNCAAIGDGVNELKALVLALQKEIQTLKSLKTDTPNTSNVDFEDVIYEINERNARKRNIVFFGIKEENNLSKEQNTTNDFECVKTIIQHLHNEIPLNNIKLFRLGKFDTTKANSRPVKLVLEDEGSVHKIIQNAKKLKDHPIFKNISVSYDRTPRQIQLFRSVKSELDRRVAEGETNLKIKHVNGKPQIVHLN